MRIHTNPRTSPRNNPIDPRPFPRCPCAGYVLGMCCVCAAYVLRMCRVCAAYVLRMCCVCAHSITPLTHDAQLSHCATLSTDSLNGLSQRTLSTDSLNGLSQRTLPTHTRAMHSYTHTHACTQTLTARHHRHHRHPRHPPSHTRTHTPPALYGASPQAWRLRRYCQHHVARSRPPSYAEGNSRRRN